MYIEKLKLTNFRNYESLDVSFSSTLNIIYGSNGSGKSNVIEAIYLLALTKSFRITNDKYLINKGKDSTTIEGKITKNNDESDYKVKISTEGKKVEIDNNKINKNLFKCIICTLLHKNFLLLKVLTKKEIIYIKS